MTSEELKKCPVPWCGGDGRLYHPSDGDAWLNTEKHTVICTECDCETDVFDTKADAIKQWNDRGDDAE